MEKSLISLQAALVAGIRCRIAVLFDGISGDRFFNGIFVGTYYLITL